MTPEREKEIREMGNGNEFTLYDAKEELLVEIDQLRAENDSLRKIAGRYQYEYTGDHPSLKLIERPKKKVKKQLRGWVNIRPTNTGELCSYYHDTKEEADEIEPNSAYPRIACVEVTGEYEVEE